MPNPKMKPRRSRAREALLTTMAAVKMAVASATAALSMSPTAPYKLQAGDTLAVAVASIPEFSNRVTVSIDGQVTIPLAGQVTAAGVPLSELQAAVRTALSTKVYRRRTEQGLEIPIMIGPDEVTVSIVDYRQVYVNGDVSRPGEQPFRPGLTIRSAVAVAGGYDMARFRMTNPVVELADLRSQHDTLWTEHAQARANVLRLDAELAGEVTFDAKFALEGPIAPALATQIADLELQQLVARDTEHRKEKTHLQKSIDQESGRAQALSEQQRQEEEGSKEDVAELNRMKELLQKGSVPITRITDARRSLLLSSTRSLQTGVQLAQVERERSNLTHRLDQLDGQRRLSRLRELQDAQVKLAGIRSRIVSVNEKLQYTGLVRSQLVRGGGAEPGLLVVRQSTGDVQRIEAGEDFAMLPGDIVEVSLKSQLLSSERP